MTKPLVAVVGRPNVGKSTFFNHVAGRRISIVDDMPGITRDRIYTEADWCGHIFDMVDTGGIESANNDSIVQGMQIQTEIAVETSDVILFIVDGRSGVQAADKEIANDLRKSGKPVIVAVNKCDTPGQFPLSAYEFYELGLNEVYPISSLHGLGIGDILDAIVAYFPDPTYEPEESPAIRVAIIGKPNVGKSSLINRLTGEERAIVSDIPGTTRDAIDSTLETDNGTFILVDTAGMRRKSKVNDDVEHFSVVRAVNVIERADVCVLMISAESGVTEQDTKIAGLAHNAGRAVVIAVNKWDLEKQKNQARKLFMHQIRTRLQFMDYAPIIFMSVKTGQKVDELLDQVRLVYDMATYRVPTGVLNDVIGDAQIMTPAPSYKGRRLKIRYATQSSVQPPTFVLFVNSTELLHFSYERYLENQLRSNFDFTGTPIRLILKGPKKEK
ncbi:MAG: ribosome biogenesis GTPase Der [Fastidiosipilaceae bacterium]|jgi:GTP-binding protein|nr:ribosome biogenesis GTPase Der [Clostridiaceae bacterium]